MPGSYREIYRAAPYQLLPGSPVVIEAAVLQKNLSTGALFVQIKLYNLSEQPICSARVTVKAYDSSGVEVETVSGFEYSHIYAAKEESFASRTPIRITAEDACRIAVSVDDVAFTDGSRWVAPSDAWLPRENGDIIEMFYARAKALMADRQDKENLLRAGKLFKTLGDYKDCRELAEKCAELAEKRARTRGLVSAGLAGAAAALALFLCFLAVKSVLGV